MTDIEHGTRLGIEIDPAARMGGHRIEMTRREGQGFRLKDKDYLVDSPGQGI